MDEKMKEANKGNWLLWGSLYATILLALICYLNYTEPSSPGPVTTPILWQLILWAALYLPVIGLPIAAQWKVTGFGFTLSLNLGLVVILVATLCAGITNMTEIAWRSSILEAFARTGEEVFFRGFLFDLFIRLFSSKRRPWLWAVFASSLLFALAHTQTFQQSYPNQVGSPFVSAVYTIVERLLNVFGIGLVLAFLRVWTRSILPGAIAHSIINSNILALPFVLVIYGLVIFWAYRRGEQVTFGLGVQAS